MKENLRAALALAHREIVRFFRQRNRVIGGLGQPILFWLLFSVGLNRSFVVSDVRFGTYFVPGTMVLILLFTAIFSTISIIEDRKEGFLQSVLVSPVSPWAMMFGKVLGGGTIAWLQGMVFLGLSICLNQPMAWSHVASIALLLAITSLAFTGLGFVIAWRLDSTQGFHAIMNLLLMPMWLLSGAFFPVPAIVTQSTTSERVLHFVMRTNPVTYVVSGIRQLMWSGQSLGNDFWQPGIITCWAVSILFGIGIVGLAWRTTSLRISGDLI